MHKGCLSLRHKGIVVSHANSVFVTDVSFIVSQKGRERVLRDKRKNVHAFVRGQYDPNINLNLDDYDKELISYNPYKFGYFYNKLNNSPVYRANIVYIEGKNIYSLIKKVI